MSITYDPIADAFYAKFVPDRVTVADTEEVALGAMIDLDEAGNSIGVEVLCVALRASGHDNLAPAEQDA